MVPGSATDAASTEQPLAGADSVSIPVSGKTGGSGAGGSAPRQARPRQVDAHYPVARMTYLTVSTEDLAYLATSSGIGSIALSATVYLYQAPAAETNEFVSVSLTFFAVIAIVAYLFFGGLIIRIRKRSHLSWWNIFGD